MKDREHCERFCPARNLKDQGSIGPWTWFKFRKDDYVEYLTDLGYDLAIDDQECIAGDGYSYMTIYYKKKELFPCRQIILNFKEI